MAKPPKHTPFIERCEHILEDMWLEVSSSAAPAPLANLPDTVRTAIANSIASQTKSYRYVLPTQLLAKLADPDLDCRSVQAASELPNPFDARSLCQHVIVDFDRSHDNVLGGSTEPYANNPLRIPSITESYRSAQKNPEGFDDLRLVLDFAQQHSEAVKEIYQTVLREILARLQDVHIVYPIPNRISLKQASAVLDSFLSERTGGLRLQATAFALLQCLGPLTGLFKTVCSSSVNASDASTGSAADIECLDSHDNIVLAVEVKDRLLTLRHVQDKLPAVRQKGIKELLFLVQGGMNPEELDEISKVVDKEFVTGQNIYTCEFRTFLETLLVLFGETNRRVFFKLIGETLDDMNADLLHRQAWRELLASI